MLNRDENFDELILAAGIIFFKHNKDNDVLEYDYSKCKTILPHIQSLPHLKLGIDFYKNIVKKDRSILRHYLMNSHDDSYNASSHIDIEYYHKPTNETLWFRINTVSHRDNDNNQYRYGTIQNITSDKSQLVKTAQIAYTDSLTGLINRERMRQKLSLAIGTAYEYGISCSAIAINIDRLSAINTMFGYHITNDLIEEIANTILKHKRNSDIIARVSSGKFIVLLINTHNQYLEQIGQRFLDIIRNTNFATRSGMISVTASASGCNIPDDANTADKVFSILEEGLTKAKKQGRDIFVRYDKTINHEQRHQENIVLSGKIIHAIKNNRIHTAYQPILHANDSNKNFMECLARIQDTNGSYIPAYKFIAIAENIGFIKYIDIKLCENALNDLVIYPHLKLSINLSGHTVHNLSENSHLINLLKSYSHVSSRMCLEFTETIALQDIENISNTIQHIKEMGYKIALDDFGAGYNSFSNLHQFKFDIVKIDGSYIKDIANNKKNQIFTQTLTELSKKLNLEIVAEMIDNEADLNFVKSLGIDYYQGYYFSEPSTDFNIVNKITYGIDDINKKAV